MKRLLLFWLLACSTTPVPCARAFETFGSPWFQPGGPGSPLELTYSYSNLFDGGLLLQPDLSEHEIVLAVEEALGLWGSHAPLTFREVADPGGVVNDMISTGGGQIRIGHHPLDTNVLAHGFPPGVGLGGDVHYDDSDRTWSESAVLYIAVHESGHALGLGHEDDVTAVMNSIARPSRYDGLNSAFLYQDDIDGIHSLYGTGQGTVIPLASVFDNGGTGQNWSTVNNWSSDAAPIISSVTQIGNGMQVVLDSDAGSVRSLLLRDTATRLSVNPGGNLHVWTDVTMQAGTTLQVELDGLDPAAANRISVDQTATLAGTISLTRLPDFGVLPGDTLEVLRYGTRSGNFTDLVHDGPVGLSLTAVPDDTAGALTLLAGGVGGDANLDGVVDQADADLLAANWRQSGLVRGWPLGDFNGDGLIDVVDLAITADNWEFGLPSPTGAPFDVPGFLAAVEQVPEPGTLVLAAFALASLVIGGGRYRARFTASAA